MTYIFIFKFEFLADMEVRARWPLGVSHVPAGSAPVRSTKHTKFASTHATASTDTPTTAEPSRESAAAAAGGGGGGGGG